jgi:hypothetical protein
MKQILIPTEASIMVGNMCRGNREAPGERSGS